MLTNLNKIVSYLIYTFSIAIISTLLIRVMKSQFTLSDTMEVSLMVVIICTITFVVTELAIKLNVFPSKRKSPPRNHS